MRHLATAGIAAMTIALSSAANATDTTPQSSEALAANALLAPSPLPDNAPPFHLIKPEHYGSAVDEGIRLMQAEVDAIATNSDAPTFENTLVALEKAGETLSHVIGTFFTVASADGTPEIQKIESEVQPKLTAFDSALYTNQMLFQRVEALWNGRASLNLSPEQARLLEVYRTRFIRQGAALPEDKRQRLSEINVELSRLSTEFSQNLVADQKNADVLLTKEEMAGMPDDFQNAAAEKAKAAGRQGYLISATRSEFEPFMQLASNRSARQKIFTAFDQRGDNGNDVDNNANIRAQAQLRLERAKLLGYKTHADFVLEESMAKTPDNAMDLTVSVYQAALKRAKQEEAEFLEEAKADGVTKLEPWDWRYYAEKVRTKRYAFDADQLKQYLPLSSMVEGLFDTTNRLFGLTFKERADLPGWRPDVRAYEVHDADGKYLGLFYADWFTRDTKQPGAWMSEIRTQNGIDGDTAIVTNNANFIPPASGGTALLSFDDVETLYHEFGHALHGLLSKTRYPSLAGTSVYRDYVEMPSQIYEHWALEPEVLSKFAVNAKGEAMPPALLEALRNANTFNQGYLTVQQLASALVDMKLHRMTEIPDDFDPRAFEKEVLAEFGVPHAIGMRHRLAHFTHLFAGGYSAGYYAYTWAEVLEADGFDAFTEAGSAFDPETAKRYRRTILETGNSRDPAESYREFRGREPNADALLRNRGLSH